MAVLSNTTVDRNGVDPSVAAVAAAGGGDSFVNTGVETVFVKNGGGSPITVTLLLQAQVDGQAAASRTVSISNGAQKIFGPFPTAAYNDGNSRMNLTYSAVTSVTVAILKNTTS
jgi:hypothetical protein